MNAANYSLAELNKETTIGGEGTTVEREIPLIDLSDFDNRKQEIADQLWKASVEIGFFQVYNHGIAQADIDLAFDTAWPGSPALSAIFSSTGIPPTLLSCCFR